MQLETSRLLLTEIQASDLKDIHRLNSYPEVAQYNTIGIPKDLETTQKVIQANLDDLTAERRTKYCWMLRDKEQGTFIGEIGLNLSAERYQRGEFYYSLIPDYWGKGYATETLRRIIKFGFETLNLHRMDAGCAVENMGSIRVLEKAGLIREGVGRMILPLQTGWSDNYAYSILETDYFK